MNCKHLQNSLCMVSTELAGIDVVAAKDACVACSKQFNPQQKNHVTTAKAIQALHLNNKPVPPSLYSNLSPRNNLSKGPGTELEKLISWFKVKSKKCNCSKRIQRMNEWGPDKCEERMDTIMRWLQHSAITHKIPFVRPVVQKLVKRAIQNARDKMGSSSNHSTP